MTKRDQQAEASRQKLIEAAKALIQEKGYTQSTINDITRACGMSVGNFYHYFKSKEDIFVTIEREPFEALSASLEQFEGTVKEGLLYYVQSYVRFSIQIYSPHFNRQWFHYHLEDCVSTPPRPNKMNLIKSEIAAILTQGIKAGELVADTPVDDISLQLAFLLMGISLYNVMTDGNFDAEAWIITQGQSIVYNLLDKYSVP